MAVSQARVIVDGSGLCFLRSRLRPFLKQELLQAIRMFVIVCVWPFLEQELLQAIWIFVAHEFVGSFLKHELP